MARKPRGQRVVDAYFSRDHFDDRETCCPLIALASDVMRGSNAVKGSYREVLEKLVEIFMSDLDEPQRRERALALAALCVGGIVTPKCVDDPALANDLRCAAHRQALPIGGWTAPTSRRQRKMPQSGRPSMCAACSKDCSRIIFGRMTTRSRPMCSPEATM